MKIDNIEKVIKDFCAATKTDVKTTAEMDTQIINDASAAHQKSKNEQSASTKPNIWRIIMKNRITKFATAVAVILIVLLGITLLDKSATPVYAIEQTIEAFKKVNSVYVEQTIREKGKSFNSKMWARRGKHGKMYFGDYRQESEYGDITVVNESENRTYYYNPTTKKVYIYKGLNVTIGSFLDIDFFSHIKEEMEDVKIDYAKDKITGKDIVFLTYREPSRYKSKCKCGVITFDLESKLPIRLKGWDNPDFKGEPWLELTLIKYNPKVPEDTFKFDIPDGAEVIYDK